MPNFKNLFSQKSEKWHKSQEEQESQETQEVSSESNTLNKSKKLAARTEKRYKPNVSEIDSWFSKIYAETFPAVSRFVISKCRGLSDCEDITQEIYTRFFRRITKKGYDDIESPEAFLINIAKFECKNYFINLGKHSQSTSFSEYSEEQFSMVEAEISRNQPELEGVICNEILAKQIFDDIANTDETAGKIFYLYFVSDMKLQDIANLLEIPLTTVKNKLYRTLERQKKKFKI